MVPLPSGTTDDGLLAYIDRWAALLEAEDYEGAFRHTAHNEWMHWSPSLIHEVIKRYGDARPSQRVTLEGRPSDVSQTKKVTRYPSRRPGGDGYIWYDLNIDGLATDLTATFSLARTREGIVVTLDDIHVM